MSAGRGEGPGRAGAEALTGGVRAFAARSYVITALGGTTPGEKEQMEEDYKKQIAELHGVLRTLPRALALATWKVRIPK